MKTEFLKELGIDKEKIDKIMAENGKDIEALKAQTEKDKNALATRKTELETLKTQLSDANKQIEDFKNLDVEGIKKASADWEQKFKKAQADSEAQIAAMKFDHALEGKLAGSKAKDVSILMGLLKKDDLKLTDDGNILGLDDQLKKLKEEKDFLFEPDEGTPQITKGGSGSTMPSGADDALRAAMGLPISDKK